MGFRDLRDFNLAMLAKQGWRMLQGNDSLLYKCFKARYFPGCSYVWRSLVVVIPILRSGYCWRVGNGSSISVLGDKWIPNYPTNKVFHPTNVLVDEMAVSELIDSDSHVWRNDAIMALFYREDADAITKIPLSRRVVPNSISWLHSKNGKFTVQSAYKVARRMRGNGNQVESSGSCVGKFIWLVLWKLSIPNKIKIFGWRACNDILLTWINLVKRRIINEDKCPICTREVETAIHVLWGYAAVIDVWVGSIPKLQKGNSVF